MMGLGSEKREKSDESSVLQSESIKMTVNSKKSISVVKVK